ncbi:MAG: carbonic anhydrase [Deltaproteobacteria bacterium]|nr:carbonic anhydrase [Deltaproteobacteria bacterium]
MKSLLQGHRSFRREFAAGARDFLTQLASEHQSPSALYVGCSDSRVVPELLTSSAPGELFVVRNIANAVPPFEHADASVGAALEYAVEVLQVGHIVVCGHYGCGGVKAVLDGHKKVKKLPSLYEWLDHLAPAIIESRLQYVDDDTCWRHAVEANAMQQVLNLSTYAIVRDRLEAGTLQLHGWVYDLANGHVSVFDAAGERFIDATDPSL